MLRRRPLSFLSIGASSLLGGGLVLGLLSGGLAGDVVAAAPSWRPTAPAAVSYWAQSAGTAWSSALAGGGRSHMPNSVMPWSGPGVLCSVENTDAGAPPSCSTNVAAVRCSAHRDSFQFCSSYFDVSGGNSAVCSTLGGSGSTCSTLQPLAQQVARSCCSAFGGILGTAIECSVMGTGSRQACSAENPAVIADNQCSTFANTTCSVLGGGPGATNYCSAGLGVSGTQVTIECSTFASFSECSVRPGQRGLCTAFVPAPAGSCSAFAATSRCSVIGSAGGTFCRWP